MNTESSHPHFVVLSFERPEGERFAIFRPDEWMRSAAPPQWATIEQFVQSLELLTEHSLRTRLEEMGLSAEAATGHIRKARNIRRMNVGGTWERVTTIGYRNEEGQEVAARTDRTGEEGQRVFVMRCSVCGHQYGTYGAEIPHRLCPNCQDGPPPVP